MPTITTRLLWASIPPGEPMNVSLRVLLAVHGHEPTEWATRACRVVSEWKDARIRLLGVVDVPSPPLTSVITPARRLYAAARSAWRDDEAQRVQAAVGRLTTSADACRAAGLPVDVVSCGGTGTYWITAALPGVTEVQAGGGVFGDVRYRTTYGVDHEQALTILTTVASRPTATRIVCDAGWKSMAVHPTPPAPLSLGAVRSLNLSAEHTTIELDRDNETMRVGDTIEFLVGYGDTTIHLHEDLYAVRCGKVIAVWPVAARGKSR